MPDARVSELEVKLSSFTVSFFLNVIKCMIKNNFKIILCPKVLNAAQ